MAQLTDPPPTRSPPLGSNQSDEPRSWVLALRYLGLPTPEKNSFTRTTSLLIAVVGIPVLFTLSIFALPILGIVAIALFGVALVTHAVYASSSHSPFALFLQPLRVLRINRASFDYVSDFILGPLPAALRYIIRTLSQPRNIKTRLKVARDIAYSSHFTMDVYPCSSSYPLPSDRTAFPRRSSDGSADEADLKPVLVILHGGMWRSGDKAIYGPAARWWRERGYVVVVGNYGIHPKVGNWTPRGRESGTLSRDSSARHHSPLSAVSNAASLLVCSLGPTGATASLAPSPSSPYPRPHSDLWRQPIPPNHPRPRFRGPPHHAISPH